MKKNVLSLAKEFIKVIIIVAIAVPVINLMAAGWTGPTAFPPNNNADAPINVSANSQEKIGQLWLNVGKTFVNGLIVDGNVIVRNGDVGIGATSPQSPAPNNQSANLDVNDVYLRSTSQWVSLSQTSGRGGGLPSGYEYAILPLEARVFKIGTTAKAVCRVFDADMYSRGEAKHDGGIVKTRAYMTGSYIANPPEAGNCDSGWVNGPSASCSSTRPGRYTVTVKAETSFSSVKVDSFWDRGIGGWSCSDEAVWQ